MSLIAHYPFINDARDYSGNSNHGTISGPYFENVGPFGRSLRFTLNSDKVVIPHTQLLSGKVFGRGNNASISIWFRPTEASEYGAIINKAFGESWSHVTFGIWQLANLNFRLALGSNAGGNLPGSATHVQSAYSLNTWYHLIAIKNNDHIALYVNGSLVGTSSLLGVSPRSENTSPITIGPRYDGHTNSLRGNISDLRIYDHALSLSEIKELSMAKTVHYNFAEFQEPTKNRIELLDSIRFTKIGEYVDIDNIRVTRLDYNRYKFEYLTNSTTNSRVIIGKLGLNTSDGSYNHTISGTVIEYNRLTSAGNFGIGIYQPPNIQYDGINLLGLNGFNRNSVTYWINPNNIPAQYTDDLAIVSNASIIAGSYLIIEDLQSEFGRYPRPYTDTFRAARINDISGFNRDIMVDQENPIRSAPNNPVFPKWVIDTDGLPAYDFVETYSALEIPFGNGLNPSVTPITISMWVKPTNNATRTFFNSRHNATNNRLYLGIHSAKWAVGVQNILWDNPIAQGSPVAVGQYSHIVAVLNGTQFRLYVNCVHVITIPYTSYTLSSNFYLGTMYNYDGAHFACDSYLRDVRIYASALSMSDITKLYKQRGHLDERGSLTAIKFDSRVGFMHKFFKQPFSTNQTTVTSLINGTVTLLSTGNDPYLVIGSTNELTEAGQVTQVLQSIDNSIYSIFEFKYRANPFTGSKKVEICFTNKLLPSATSFHANLVVESEIIADGEWHVARIDMKTNANWLHSRVMGLRLDYTTVSGVTMEIDYIALVKERDSGVKFTNNGEFQVTELVENGGLNQLSHWWPLDNTLREMSAPIEYNAIAEGHSPVDVFDKMGYEMSGNGSYINCNASQVDMNFGTISLWVKIDPTQSWADNALNIFNASTSNYQWIRIFSVNNSIMRFYYRTNASTVYNIDILRTNNELGEITSKFTHLVMQYADANDGGFIRVFINGILISQASVPTNIQTVTQSDRIILMADAARNNPTKGIVSDLRIYRKLLSDQEILNLYRQKTDSNHLMGHSYDGKLYIKGTFKEV